MHGARLIGTTLASARMESADLAGAEMGWTQLTDARLETACGLDRVKHLGPSLIDFESISRCFTRTMATNHRAHQREPITQTTVIAFARGLGVPEAILETARGRSSNLSHASCFVSHSSTDVEFATKLHADIQNSGVRCWYSPENMRVGDDIKLRIHDSIREHTKMVVILSRAAFASEWVRFEVEIALQEEKRNSSKKVLLPIRIDDSVESATVDWVRSIRGARHIADFRGWSSDERYRRAVRLLIDDLVAPTVR
jgi:hypothetical protein